MRGPGARRGHSLVLHHKPATDTEKATTKIVLFGGRSNEIFKQHVPKTYEIKISSGTIDFVSYDKSPIKTEMCTTNDQENKSAGTRSTLVSTSTTCGPTNWTAIAKARRPRTRSAAASSAASDVLLMTIARIKSLRSASYQPSGRRRIMTPRRKWTLPLVDHREREQEVVGLSR